MIVLIGDKAKLYLVEEEIKSESYEVANDLHDIGLIVSKFKYATHYSQLIIDVGVLNNPTAEIVQSLYLLKCACSTNIVLIAQGEDGSNELLNGLIEKGLYNFITSLDKDNAIAEMQDCLIGRTLSDVSRYIIKSDILPAATAAKQGKVKRKTVDNLKIGIAGICPRIGVTTQALHLTKYLCNRGITACYFEQNKSGHMRFVKDVFSDAVDKGDHIEYSDVPIFFANAPTHKTFNNIVCDFGADISKLKDCDVKIILLGSTAWEIVNSANAIESLKECDNVSYIYSFCGENENDDIADFMDTNWSKTHFAPYSPDVFTLTDDECVMYEKLFAPKSSTMITTITPIQQPPKKGLFKK